MCANFWPSRRPRRARKGACHHEWAPTPTHPFSSPSPSPSLALALRVRRKIKGSRSGHTNAIPSGVTSSRQVSHLFPFLRVVPHTRTHTAHRGARTSDLLFAPPTAEHQVRSALKVVARDALTPGWRAAPRRGARYALCGTGVRTHHRAPPHQLAARGGDSPLTRGRRPAKMQLSLHFTQVSAARAAHTARHPPKKQKKGPVTTSWLDSPAAPSWRSRCCSPSAPPRRASAAATSSPARTSPSGECGGAGGGGLPLAGSSPSKPKRYDDRAARLLSNHRWLQPQAFFCFVLFVHLTTLSVILFFFVNTHAHNTHP